MRIADEGLCVCGSGAGRGGGSGCRGWCLSGPLLGDVHRDLVEEVAGVEGGFAGGLEETDDAFMVGRNEERKVSGSELGEGGGGNDEGWGAAKLLGCCFRWPGLGGFDARGFKFCESWFRRAFGRGGDWRRRLREEGVEVNFADIASVNTVERRQDLLGHTDAMRAPFGEEQENGGGAVVGV